MAIYKKGEILVCVQKNWEDFTYGKHYVLEKDYPYNDYINLVSVISDSGEDPLPAMDTLGERNFVSLKEWREMKINEIL